MIGTKQKQHWKEKVGQFAFATFLSLLCNGTFAGTGYAAEQTGSDVVNGLEKVNDPDSGLSYMMPPGFFRTQRKDGSTSTGDSLGSHFSVEIFQTEFKTEADVNIAMQNEAERIKDNQNERALKVHDCPARQWTYKNQLGSTKIMALATPKYFFQFLWHADVENDATLKAADLFFKSINPNCQKCKLPKN